MSDDASQFLAQARRILGDLDGRDAGAAGAALERLARAATGLAVRAPNAEDAEACRLVMLVASMAQNRAEAEVWRARCFSRAAAIHWDAALGSLVMAGSFKLLAARNDDYAQGRTLDRIKPAPGSVEIMDEVELLLKSATDEVNLGGAAPTVALLRRFVHEKRGFLLLVAGALEDARRSYLLAAAAVAGQPRGEVKVALGAALVDYVAARERGESGQALGDRTAKLGTQAAAAGFVDLATTAEVNAAAMGRGSLALEPYEIL